MMRKMANDMVSGFRHEQRDGWLEVVEYKSWDEVLVRFDNGYEVYVQAGQIRKGTVKNRMKRTVFGVGFMGVGAHKSCSGRSGVHSKMYQDWKNMISRCYNPERIAMYPSYADCSVCESWLNFQNFGDWYVDNYPKDGGEYHLDKDILSSGYKVYSPSTCSFVSPFDNYQKAHAKSAKLKNPDGVVLDVYNVSNFCRENGLSQSAINEITIGKRKSYKGWSSVND